MHSKEDAYNLYRLDIEGGSTYWKTASYNQAWITEALQAAASLLGQSSNGGSNNTYNNTNGERDGGSPGLGIYTNLSEWTGIVGSSWAGGSGYPLW